MKPPAKPAPPPITPDQMREARAALGWPSDLTPRSGNTAYGVIKYERFGRVTSKRGQSRDFDVLASIRAALEAAGIEFTNGNPPSVRRATPSIE